MSTCAPRWLAACGLTLWAACGGEAVAPRRVAAPVSPVATSAPAAAAPTVEPVAPSAPTVEPVAPSAPAAPAVEPPAPVAALTPAPEPAAVPPCPTDRRDERQKPEHVLALLELAEAMTVVDLGAGDGYFLCRLSRAVGSRGRVVATEIARPLVRALEKRIASEQLSNAEVIQAPANDVGIAAGTADRILLVNVWHHLPNRRRYATRIARALAPGGKVVILDFAPRSWGNDKHGIAATRVLAELKAGGIDGALVTEDLPHQYVIVGSVRTPASDARAP